jgi:flagellar hook-length control protein FliK
VLTAAAIGATAAKADDEAETQPPESGEDFKPSAPPLSTNAAANAASTAAQAPHAAAVRGAPQTVANLAAQIIKKLEARSTRFDLQLDPAGLGKVNVRVEIGAEGQITAALACHNPQAAEELRARSSELQRALEQAGFDVSGGLSFDVAGGHTGHSGAGHGQDDGGKTFHSRAFQSALDTAGEAAQLAIEGALGLNLSRADGVDIRI